MTAADPPCPVQEHGQHRVILAGAVSYCGACMARWDRSGRLEKAPLIPRGEAVPSVVVESALEAARRGPCQKSKRGAVAFLMHDPRRRIPGHNRPASPTQPCDGSPACRAACGQICNHAEENAVLEWLRSGAARDGGHAFDVLHIEVDGAGEPLAFDRPGKPSRPSCITCARLMYAAGVRRVWLFGVGGWRSWTSHEFLHETMDELGIARSP